MSAKRLMILLPVAALMLFGAGCIFSPEPDPIEKPPVVTQFPDTADKLMDNFKVAYSNMQYEKYQEVLHANFRFLFKPEDAVGLPDDVLTRDEELTISYNMFSGEPRPQPEGPPEPGITQITISVLNRKDAWIAVDPSDPNFYEPEDAPNGKHASQYATYEVQMQIERGDEGKKLQVVGDTIFFVASRDSLVGGVIKPYYQLRGQRDLTRSTGG